MKSKGNILNKLSLVEKKIRFENTSSKETFLICLAIFYLQLIKNHIQKYLVLKMGNCLNIDYMRVKNLLENQNDKKLGEEKIENFRN